MVKEMTIVSIKIFRVPEPGKNSYYCAQTGNIKVWYDNEKKK